MTARFGRNKRRAALAAVAAARAETEQVKARSEMQVRQARQGELVARRFLESIAERIIMATGDDSALLPVGLERVRGMPKTHTKYPVRQKIDPVYSPGPDVSAIAFMPMDDVVTLLYRLVMVVEDRPHDFAKLIRFRNENESYGGPNKFTERAIMVSEMTLMEIGMRSDEKFYFVEHLVEQLFRHEDRP